MNCKIVTNNGYEFHKSLISDNELNIMKNELIVEPNMLIKKKGMQFKLFKEDEYRMYLPRFYGVKKYGYDDMIFHDYEKINLEFTSKLRSYQIDIINKCMNGILNNGGGLLSLPCGRGKTVISLFLIHLLKCKTLVICHKSSIFNQWIDRINQFLINVCECKNDIENDIVNECKCDNSVKIGIIKGPICNIKSKDICIAMIQSISAKDYGDIYKSFGLVIYDEAHHVSAKYFSRSLMKTNCKYIVGLSATPTRIDGLTKVIHWFIGDILYKEKQKMNNNVNVKIIDYMPHFDDPDIKYFKNVKRLINGRTCVDTTSICLNLSKIRSRNLLISTIANDMYKLNNNGSNRNIIILAKTKQQLIDIYDNIIQLNDPIDDIESETMIRLKNDMMFYTGDTSENNRRLVELNAKIILATFGLAEEGLDIDRLNTLILASPKKSIEQTTGRIIRKEKYADDDYPLIFDIHDKLDGMKGLINARMKYYDQNDFCISEY